MATENEQTILEENTSEVSSDVSLDSELFADNVQSKAPSDSELFAGQVQEELSEREVFVGDEDFYKSLTDSVQTDSLTDSVQADSSTDSVQADATQTQRTGTGPSRLLLAPIEYKRFSKLQKILVASIAVIAVMLLYASLKSPSEPVISPPPTPAAKQTPLAEPPVGDSPLVAPRQTQRPEPAHQQTQPLSLKLAETFYLQKDYEKAYAAYDKLRQSLPTTAEKDLLRDFLQLKMALCKKKAGDSDQASRLFGTVLQSRCLVVRMMANYYLSFIEMQKERYLKARTRAYKAIALIDAVDFEGNWASSLLRDCHLLTAESITRYILSLCDADKGLPRDLWSKSPQIEPFTNLSETQLRPLLKSGSEQLSKALLSPQIQELENHGTSAHWSVTCHSAPIEELLARFSINADLDIHWAFGRAAAPEATEDTICKRPVSLYMAATTPQQFVSAAAGYVGLLARLEGTSTVNIFNPANYSSLSEHISLLSLEAISLWQRFMLKFDDDQRLPNAHFALGLLQTQRDQVDESIAEYKLVANRFSQTSLAPFALLNSSKLKANLRDYFGARDDLKQLVEQYPDAKIAHEACLHLADATMKTQLYEEAQRLYRKVYHLSFSSESQTAAALGASKCLYTLKDYQSATKWLKRYINLVKDTKSRELYSAYLLLGKSNLALGKPRQACEALQHALAGVRRFARTSQSGAPEQLSSQEHVEIISALVEGYTQQELFVEALDVLENVDSERFSQKESIQISLLKSRTLRAIGLVDEAIAVLGDKVEYILEPQLKAETSFELTNCYIAKGNLKLAYKNLTEILTYVEAGPLAHKTALKLADVCLKLGQNSQAISVCLQLLDLGPSAPIKQKASELLAVAYSRQKDYDRAALALLGRGDQAKAANEKRTLQNSSVTGQSSTANLIKQDN